MRRFSLVRTDDVSGVSGTGIVADGVLFPNGKCSLCWRGALSSIAMHDSLETLEAIHGHGGRTYIEFIDSVPSRHSKLKLNDLTTIKAA